MQKALLCFLLLVLAYGSKCQSKTDKIDSLVALSELYYGANDKLNYGRLYRINERGASGHPFFETKNYEPSTLFIKDNTFNDVFARLDLENKLVLVKLEQKGQQREVIISAEALDSFYLLNHLFIRGDLVSPQLAFYHEKIYFGKTSLIKSYGKEFIAIYNKAHPRGSYSSLQSKLILVRNQEIVNVTTKRRFIKAMAGSKDLIKQWLKEHKTRFKKLTHDQLKDLMIKCESNA